ncbi:hemicentin-1-like isoform X3 [Bufo bufo]|uniref:hemicentin-1-like isoform X3 n=1 Tax=Bufo bufo TaxID=8384 RepID=UPI001ABEC984|nr:hemicentin-1-like isoform X3 [Bufo bufo]
MSALCLCVLAWIILPILALDTENPDVDRPIVSFTPDWRSMFYNETLTLSCLYPSNVQKNETYTWYRDNNKMDISTQNFTVSSIQLYDRANYKCQTRTSMISESVRPHVITDLAILRVSRYVFEGDILTLTCDSRLDMDTTNAVASFTKNYKVVKSMNYETYLFVGKVDRSVDGKYKCTKKAILKSEIKDSDNEELIEVTELFSPPELKISANPISVGMDMTLTCVTSLHPFRADVELQFAFYRDGWHVQGFGSSNKYILQSVQLGDSGEYSCEVRTLMNSVNKISKQQPVLIQESFKPLLSFYPNWNKVFRYDLVHMTCNDQRSKRFTWYKDNVRMLKTERKIMVNANSNKDIGHYQCQGESGEKSDPVHLDIFFVWLILQAPLSIHEGDSVTLECKMWRSGSALNTTFYKDDNMIKFLGLQSDLKLGTVNTNATGKYKCTRFINTGSASKVYVAEEYISVAELFTSPEIRVNLHPVVEGADMTLTCHTTISPLRQSTRLAFAFYKNGKTVQEFGESNKYRVSSAQLEDSGSYACEVKSSFNVVKKISKAVPIDVQGMAVVSFEPNFGKILTTENMTLTCKVDPKIVDKQAFYWYKDGNQMNITQPSLTIQDALVSDSGYYQCRSTNTHMSEPLRLDVSNSNLIVQAPPSILEGDNLALSCHSRQGLDLRRKIFTYLVLKVKNAPIIEGEPMTLSCDVALNSALNPLRGSTTVEFAFYKDGQKIQDFTKLHTYEIKTAMTKNSGNYTCNVKCSLNDVVRTSQELEVTVQELFSTPVFMVNPTNIELGKQMTLQCDYTVHADRMTADLRPTIFKNGKATGRVRTSRILSAQEQNSGDYICEVADSSRNIIKYSNTIHILVEERVVGAKISADRQDLKMMTGSNVTFTCSVREGTSLSFTWLHNFKKIDKNCAIYQVRQDGRVLFIESILEVHSGSYQCIVSNHFSSSDTNKLEVTVIEPIGDAILRTDSKVLNLMPQESFSLTCSLTQGNGTHFFWIHNKQELKQDTSTYEFREGGKVLHIKSAQLLHEGSYQCRVAKDISSGRTLVSESGTLTLKISSKDSSYLKPLLIVMVVASILLIGILVYKYQNKLVIPNFLQGKPQKTTFSLKTIEDKVLLVDNMEILERTSNSHQ